MARLAFLDNEKGITNGNSEGFVELEMLVTKQTVLKKNKDMHIIHSLEDIVFLKLATPEHEKQFEEILKKVQNVNNSVFIMRTEDSSANQYFQFYGYLSQQQNMMQDFVRTSTYQKAINGNYNDFNDKIVLDVGAGSGILSFFAAQAGAKRVYAVEASNMAQYAQQLVASNNLGDRITVIAGKIEEIELPEKVDIIISEPMGYMLYNERMLETYLHAKKWLKPNGKMFPSRGDLHVAPFSDEALYMEQYNKANFWYQTSFHSVDLSSLREAAMKEYFRQPIVDTFDIRICQAKSIRHVVDFLQADEEDLHRIGEQAQSPLLSFCFPYYRFVTEIPLDFQMLETGTCHGLAFWFDVEFCGSTSSVWLSTSPTEPLTHW
jgi:type I protein arginine methyltransferase